MKRQELSDAVTGLGWRYLVADLQTQVLVPSLQRAVEVAERVVAVAGADADDHLRLDIGPDRVGIRLQARGEPRATARDVEMAAAISEALGAVGMVTAPGASDRTVQVLELGIDAMDIQAIRPFWQAALGYTAQAWDNALVDPAGQGPTVWFQQMDSPRPQRNRVHFDVSVPHDEAQRRIKAVLAAAGRLTYDAEAPAFWVFADPEGNEVCICTWQARPEPD